MTVRHHFTVDVEEYFHPTALAPYFPPATWDTLERRSPRVLPRLLDLMASHDVVGTFFVVGWLAEREPDMVRAIAEGGHEIASHGYEHELVGRLGPDGFRDSVRRSKAVLEALAGAHVSGYRAPSFSIVPGLEWAFDVLVEEGYGYDASLVPTDVHPTYGYPVESNDPHWIECAGGRLAEFPASTLQFLGRSVPASGGAYFRILPPTLVRMALHRAADRGCPGMFYVHPWEFDAWKPRVRAPRLQMIRTFLGRTRVLPRMDWLMASFEFGPIRETLRTMERSDTVAPGPSEAGGTSARG
jgi:polysaccharide deacetylase family protein (PEP-CTERM system associated)